MWLEFGSPSRNNITARRIQISGIRGNREIVGYVLVYKGIKLAVAEAKSDVVEIWGEIPDIGKLFIEFQEHLYQQIA